MALRLLTFFTSDVCTMKQLACRIFCVIFLFVNDSVFIFLLQVFFFNMYQDRWMWRDVVQQQYGFMAWGLCVGVSNFYGTSVSNFFNSISIRKEMQQYTVRGAGYLYGIGSIFYFLYLLLAFFYLLQWDGGFCVGGLIGFLDTLTYIFFYLPGFFLIGRDMVPDYVVKL